MKKLFYALSLLAIILSSIFFSWYIAFALIIQVLCFGYGIYKFRNSSNEYDEEYEKTDEEVTDEEVNLELSSDEEKVVDGAIEFLTKLYFSENYEEFIKNLSGEEIQVIEDLFKNCVSTEEIETNNFDSNIFKSVGSEDFEEMLYLSSNLH